MPNPMVGAQAPPASTRPVRDQSPTTGATGPTAGHLRLLAAAAAGGAVALSLGVYGRLHSPTGETIWSFGFPSLLAMKSWFTTIAVALGLTQVLSAAWLYGRLPRVGPAPAALGPAHRWSGALAFLFTLPAAYHCLWALGFQGTDTRVLIHSILGCAFYGALTTKLLILRSSVGPTWALPVAGGLLMAVLTGIWMSSSLWFFSTFGFPGW